MLKTSNLRVGLSRSGFSCLMRQRWKKKDLFTKFNCCKRMRSVKTFEICYILFSS